MPRLCWALIVGVFALGCSRAPTATVTGTVTLDGQPVSDASVQLWPKEKLGLGVYSGRTDAVGRFLLRTREVPEVKPGEYCALVSREVKKDGTLPGPGDDWMALAAPGALRNTLPAIYYNREHPQFIFDIKPGDNDLPLELKTPKR
ncbi:hypothetical protein AYO40_01680 [Planctomycetaceae bacterium SCGC AG-212-D15]|nr:hypothetical protein AYO40_01680 [Planctomycetaceae bacterium SCGC AG-212-D15]